MPDALTNLFNTGAAVATDVIANQDPYYSPYGPYPFPGTGNPPQNYTAPNNGLAGLLVIGLIVWAIAR